MIALLHLFISFFTIGCFAFGGGYAILPFLQKMVVQNGWMTTERFADFIAISQSTPGPIAINMATFIGFQSHGLPGAFVATFAVALPGMLLMIFVAIFFLHFYERPGPQAVFKGLRPAVVGLIASAAWEVGRVSIIDGKALMITVVSMLLIVKWNVGPVPLIAGAAIVGILLF